MHAVATSAEGEPGIDELETQVKEVVGVAGSKRRTVNFADGSDLSIEAGDRRTGLLTPDDDVGVCACSEKVEGQNTLCERAEHIVSGVGQEVPSAAGL